MSKLNGKAKEEFLKYYKKKDNIKLFEFEKVEIVFNLQKELYKNALIIEWFDSVGIYVNIHSDFNPPFIFGYSTRSEVYNKRNAIGIQNKFEYRTEATTKAIEKANEIYNNLHQ